MSINFKSILPYSAFFMAFFLPLHMGISNAFLILFFLGSSYLFFVKKQYVLRNYKVLSYSLLPIFLLYIIGVFYSVPAFVGVKIIGRNIAFLLCPLLLLFHSKNLLLRLKNMLFKGIVYGSVLAVILLLVNNFLNYFATRPFPNLDDEILGYHYTYYNFTALLDQHPSYFGVFVIFSLSLLIKVLFYGLRKFQFAVIIGIIVNSLGVFFLNSRVVFLFYVLVLAAALLWKGVLLYRRKKFVMLGIVTALSLSFSAMGVYLLSNTFIASRFTNELQWELSDQVDTSYNNKIAADSRVARWEVALEAISENVYFGHGSYTEKNILADYYKKHGMMISYTNRYDAHNLYLSFMVEFGIFGLLILLFFLFSNIYFSIKSRDPEYFLLFFMICIISCFESYLKNNAAITFVAFFGSVLLFSNYFPASKKEIDANQ